MTLNEKLPGIKRRQIDKNWFLADEDMKRRKNDFKAQFSDIKRFYEKTF